MKLTHWISLFSLSLSLSSFAQSNDYTDANVSGEVVLPQVASAPLTCKIKSYTGTGELEEKITRNGKYKVVQINISIPVEDSSYPAKWRGLVLIKNIDGSIPKEVTFCDIYDNAYMESAEQCQDKKIIQKVQNNQVTLKPVGSNELNTHTVTIGANNAITKVKIRQVILDSYIDVILRNKTNNFDCK